MHDSLKLLIPIITIMLVVSWFCSGCDEEPKPLSEFLEEQATTDENDSNESSNQYDDVTSFESDDEVETGNNDKISSNEDNDTAKVDSDEANPVSKVDSDKPDADKPDADKPDADKPDADKPDADKPDADKPDADKPDADVSDDNTVVPKVDSDETDSTDDDQIVSVVDSDTQEASDTESSEAEAIAVGNCQLACFAAALPSIAMCMTKNEAQQKSCESNCLETTQSCSEECILQQGSGYGADTQVIQNTCELTCSSQESTANATCMLYTTDENKEACEKLAEKNKKSCIEAC